MLYVQDSILRRLGFSRCCPQAVEFGIGGDASFPCRRGHSIDVKLRHNAVVKGRSEDDVDCQVVMLEQCFELLPRLWIAGHNSRHMFANLRQQTPVERRVPPASRIRDLITRGNTAWRIATFTYRSRQTSHSASTVSRASKGSCSPAA